MYMYRRISLRLRSSKRIGASGACARGGRIAAAPETAACSQRSTVPLPPLTQTSLAEVPQIPYRDSVVPWSCRSQLVPFQRNRVPRLPAMSTSLAELPQTASSPSVVAGRWSAGGTDHAAPSHLSTVPSRPTAHALLAELPQTATRLSVTPLGCGRQALPSQLRMPQGAPAAPSAQA